MRTLSTQHAKLSQGALAMRLHAFDSIKARLRDAQDDTAYKTPWNFLSSITDTELLATLRAIHAGKVTPQLKKVFVVGIGGANLGSKAIIDTLPKGTSPEFIFLDTLYTGEPEELASLIYDIHSVDELVVIIISKSGKTLETLSGAQLLVSMLERSFGAVSQRIVVVTAESSPLHVWASACGVTSVLIPQAISDRYSVFSAVGVLPLLFAGVSIEELYAGASEALNSNLPSSVGPAFEAACALDEQNPKGVHGILDLFFFSEKLETLGKWGRQLIAESLGKESTITGLSLSRSLTPTVSIGTTDLHSMLQLYLAQPAERITWFTTLASDSNHSIGLPQELKALFPGIDKETPDALINVIYKEVSHIYERQGIPYLQTNLDALSVQNIGYYMMTMILTTLGLAELWQIDPWDQPNVEEYKDNVRKKLLNR